MKTRIDYIDNVKGILILLVVLGHCIDDETYLKTVIYSFHMPAFFIISGILLNYSLAVRKNFWGFLLSRIRRLLIPYILFEFLGYLVQCFTEGFYENLNGFIFRAATFQVHTDVDWFLIGLFFGEIAFYFARKNKYIAIASDRRYFYSGIFSPCPIRSVEPVSFCISDNWLLWDAFLPEEQKIALSMCSAYCAAGIVFQCQSRY